MEVMVKKDSLLTFFEKGTNDNIQFLDDFVYIKFPNMELIISNYNREMARNKYTFVWDDNAISVLHLDNSEKDVNIPLALNTLRAMTKQSIKLSSMADDLSMLVEDEDKEDYNYFAEILSELCNRAYKEFNREMQESLLASSYEIKNEVVKHLVETINYIVGESNEI